MTRGEQMPVIDLDFQADFRTIVAEALARLNIVLDPSEVDDAVYFYFAILRRRIAARPRHVIEAKELVCPAQLVVGYGELKSELECGIDVTRRLSRTTKNVAYEDMMLNDWGIAHLHLGIRDPQGEVPRTEPVLFVLVRDDAVYVIGFFPHGAWAEIEVLEAVQRNWPHLMEHARVYGVTGYEAASEERAKLRAAGAITLTNVNGVVYAPPGGGYTRAKTSGTAHKDADSAMIDLEFCEKHVRLNVARFLKQIEDLGRVAGTPPAFHFWVNENGDACAMEPTAEVNFILGSFPRLS
jgi:hypothetical protein